MQLCAVRGNAKLLVQDSGTGNNVKESSNLDSTGKKGPKKLRIICAQVSSGPTFRRYIELGNRDGFMGTYIAVKDVKCQRKAQTQILWKTKGSKKLCISTLHIFSVPLLHGFWRISNSSEKKSDLKEKA